MKHLKQIIANQDRLIQAQNEKIGSLIMLIEGLETQIRLQDTLYKRIKEQQNDKKFFVNISTN